MNLLPQRLSFLLALLPVIVLLGACARSGAMQSSGPPPEPQTVANIDASGDDYVYYSLRENRPVEAAEAWDIAFQSTNIRINGSMQLVETPFDSVRIAPEAGYQRDDSGQTMLPGGSGNGWYNYDSGSHKLMPIPNRTIVLKTTAETYAKVEILSYYFMSLPAGSDAGGDPRYYTFRYAHQADGSRVVGR